jgi:hypothetical protein
MTSQVIDESVIVDFAPRDRRGDWQDGWRCTVCGWKETRLRLGGGAAEFHDCANHRDADLQREAVCVPPGANSYVDARWAAYEERVAAHRRAYIEAKARADAARAVGAADAASPALAQRVEELAKKIDDVDLAGGKAIKRLDREVITAVEHSVERVKEEAKAIEEPVTTLEDTRPAECAALEQRVAALETYRADVVHPNILGLGDVAKHLTERVESLAKRLPAPADPTHECGVCGGPDGELRVRSGGSEVICLSCMRARCDRYALDEDVRREPRERLIPRIVWGAQRFVWRARRLANAPIVGVAASVVVARFAPAAVANVVNLIATGWKPW